MEGVSRTLESLNPAPEAFQSVKAYDAALKNYVTTLEKLPRDMREAILLNPAESLQISDPALNSIGCLAILDILLNAAMSQSALDRDPLLAKTLQFLFKFDPYQIRYAGTWFRNLLEQIGSGSLFPPLVAVELLANSILRIDPSGSMFTSTHLIMARLAYDANCLEPALRVIDSDITSYPLTHRLTDARRLCDRDLEPSAYISTATGLTDGVKNTSVLEYHLLRALIYMSRRDWPKAQAALEQVIAHPTKDRYVSKIMADCYKKWILVGLLNEGKPPTIPHYVTVAAKPTYTILSDAYNHIAALFVLDDVSELRAEIEKERRTWDNDENGTLIVEIMSAYQKWQIINLRRIYHQVSISQIRNTTFSAETGQPLKDDQAALSLVREMIVSGMLKGELQVGPNGEESYLTFHEDHDLITEAEFAMEIARSHHNIEALSKQYRVANERLGASKDYLRHLAREQKRMEKEGADAGLGFDSQIEDEDLMTGVVSHA